VPTTYQLTAHVVASPNHSGQVQAAQNGRVDTAKVPLPHLGQWVEQGQLVGHIRPIAARFEQGNQLAQQAELSSALRLAEKRHARLIKLKGSVPEKEIDAALNQVDSLKARLSAVVKSLRGLEPLYAPISGYITAVEVTPGQIVESQTTLFEIVDPSRMQVEALAYDRQTTLMESAYSVNRAGDQLDLELLGVGVNLKGHAIPMLFEVSVDDPPLAIGEALTVYVSGKQRIQGIVLPRSSLVKGNQGEDLVWVHSQAERFAPKAVRWSAVSKDHIAVIDGLHDGDRVVIQGATLLSQIR
jgi:RND family efflux transporter MFP subunit